MRFGINTFLFTSPFTNQSTKLFGQFKRWGFDSVEIPVEAPSHIDPAHPLVAAAQSAARDVLGRDVPLGTMPAFTDGTHWHLAGSACIPAFGPGTLLVAHRPNEHIEVAEVVAAARIYALTAMRYLSTAHQT